MTNLNKIATIIQQNPCSITLDNHYGGHYFSRLLLITVDVDGTNIEIAQAKKIVKLRQNIKERKQNG